MRIRMSWAFAFLLLFSPAIAKADVVFKCKSGDTQGTYQADLRFDERGRNGRIELDLWNEYPPKGLVYGGLQLQKEERGYFRYLSQPDPHTKMQAELAIPTNFLGEANFSVALRLIEPNAQQILLSCDRF